MHNCVVYIQRSKYMERFYIDTHNGVSTWINVENGIVKNIESNLNPKISEEYVGKTISFMKEDFEKRMKPSWCCIHCYRWSTILAPMNNIKSQRSMAYNFHSSRMQDGVSEKKSTEMLNAQLAIISRQENALMTEYNSLKDELENIHHFKVKYKF